MNCSHLNSSSGNALDTHELFIFASMKPFMSFICYFMSVVAEMSVKTEVLGGKNPLLELYRKGMFRLQSISQKRGLSANLSGLSLVSCEPPSAALLWKWVSRHHLFNLGTCRYLGINVTNFPDMGIFDCDVSFPIIWWCCGGSMLYGAGVVNNKLAVVDSRVVLKRATLHKWRIYSGAGEGPCAYPYKVTGCEFWESHPELNACYQFNLYSVLTWSQALTSCQSQVASLLSITQSNEQIYIRERLSDMGVMVWIGLNHLSQHGGWQWSDGSPLALVSFTSDLTSTPMQQNQQCGVFDSTQGSWQSLSCESALSYICKKTNSYCREAEPLVWDLCGVWRAVCLEGGAAVSEGLEEERQLDKITDQEQTFEDVVKGYYCKAPLVTIESRFEQAFVNSLISVMGGSDSRSYWTALQDRNRTGEYHWLIQNGSFIPLTYTNWNQHQPVSGGGCVLMSGGQALGHWEVKHFHTYKALAVCTQEVSSNHDALRPLPHINTSASCPTGWESRKDLPDC
ncbi:secretory phospholipase A2 receptor [Myxocyprinus asiaticus]|uniref:secretory phospholipase A2 receptor n=1 Tax=Myxocyprinus asiaticus TaxID=70543 RepID=UPI0022230F39|nr:secretory phospholipase A2 receptor [Myxocyprinus asiaticus]